MGQTFFSFFKNFKLVISILFKIVSIFIRKLIISSQIVFEMLLILVNDFFYFLSKKINDNSTRLELKSFLITFFLGVFFYYIFIVELCTWLFGYSLLCYWFLFILTFLFVIISWQIETFYIKTELKKDSKNYVVIQKWIDYYGGETPFSFFNYITNYNWKKHFKHYLFSWYQNDLSYGRSLLITFYFLLILFFFYTCSYWFDPRLVNFISWYFYPNSTFFDVRWLPWLDDIISAPIWFRNKQIWFLKSKYSKNKYIMFILNKIPKPNEYLENISLWQYAKKMSIRKQAPFSDIFFLRSLYPFKPVWKLVFTSDAPTITMDWFDQNWNLLFLRYITSKFLENKENFWTKNFSKDPKFWTFINFLAKDLHEKITQEKSYTNTSYLHSKKNVESAFETLYISNYLDGNNLNKKKFLSISGPNLDLHEQIINSENKFEKNNLQSIFTTWLMQKKKLTIEELIRFQKENPSTSYLRWNLNFYFQDLKSFYDFYKSSKETPSLDDFLSILKYNNETSLYPYNDYINFLNPSSITNLKMRTFKWKSLLKLIWGFDIRLAWIELLCGLKPKLFKKKDYKTFSWKKFGVLLTTRVNWIELYLSKWDLSHLFNYVFPNRYEISDYLEWYFWPSGSLKWIAEKYKKKFKSKKKYIKFLGSKQLVNLSKLEERLWVCEWLLSLWPKLISLETSRKVVKNDFLKLNLREQENPWFIKNLNFFGSHDIWFIMPNWVRFLYPTKYAASFSTFGYNILRYHEYANVTSNDVVADTQTLLGDWTTTPILNYTGVEALLYLKPLLKVFDTILNFIVWLFTYPIEWISTSSWSIFSNSLSVLILSAHLTWFIHYYIYFLVIAYCLYYILLFYYYKVGFAWFYESMGEALYVSQHNGEPYWHPINDIWLNYKTPEEFLLLKIHTLSLLNYTFKNYSNYLFITKSGYNFILEYLYNLQNNEGKFNNYINFKRSYVNWSFDSFFDSTYYPFECFYRLSLWKYKSLLHKGGSDCNKDTLIWSYYNYLLQTSLYISRALWKNKFKISNPTYLNSLLKQFTILMSTNSTSETHFFLSTPLQNTVLARKLFFKLFLFFKNELLLKGNFNDKKSVNVYFSFKKDENLIFKYLDYSAIIFNKLNFFSTSPYQLYDLLNNLPFFLSKLKADSFWNDIWYWILAFFWSIWFINKSIHPYINFHLKYEQSLLRLSWVAYSNSWISHSMQARPFYNIIQNIWWSSAVFFKASPIVDAYNSINRSGVSTIDWSRNFLEKRYSISSSKKVETIFGFVKSLVIPEYQVYKGENIYNYNFNFDTSHPEETYNLFSTNRGYNKTNSPLNIIELGITPQELIDFVSLLPTSYKPYYLTFLNQIDLIDDTLPDLTSESGKKKSYINNIFSINKSDLLISNSLDSETLYEHDYYTKYYKYNKIINKENFFKNWILGFDVSFFFYHFLTWDNFIPSVNWPDNLFYNDLKKNFFSSKNINNIFTFEDINTRLTSSENWFKKPIGSLDKFELISLKRYKGLKQLDYLSKTWVWEDPFIQLDHEDLLFWWGSLVNPYSDDWTLQPSYTEEFSGFWTKKFPYNTPLLTNSVKPIILGWVGEIHENSLDITNFFFSMQYFSSKQWYTKNNFFELDSSKLITFNGLKLLKNSSFSDEPFMYKKVYTWVNIFLHPSTFWYSFGLKSQARQDYFSWKAGFFIDYTNGVFCAWKYSALRHSFGSWLVPFDSTYGFYKTYRQLEDNPNKIDSETYAYDYLLSLELEGEDNLDDFDFSEDDDLAKSLALAYKELYYCFQHPYFLGYFMYWFIFFVSSEYYLGNSNFSFKRYLIYKLIDLDYKKKLSLSFFRYKYKKYRSWEENLYWKFMYWYWIYWLNPIQLTSYFDIIYSKTYNTTHIYQDQIFNFFQYINGLVWFFKFKLNLNLFQFLQLVDLKKHELNLLWINWLSLDIPFTLNPYFFSVQNNSKLFFECSSDFINTFYFWFSHYDSLWEAINFNSFFDWSSGVFLDVINLTFYYSSFRSFTSWSPIFLDKPSLLAHDLLRYDSIAAKKLVQIYLSNASSENFNILVGEGILFYNMSLIHFFNNINFSSAKSTLDFYPTWNLSSSLDFYIRDSFSRELFVPEIKNSAFKFTKMSQEILKPTTWLKHLFLRFWINNFFSLDSLNDWLSTNHLFLSFDSIDVFFNSLKYKIFSNFYFLEKFYKKIGIAIWYFFFWKF